MYTLYYKPGACSMAVHVVLNELDVAFDAVRQNDLKDPEFLKLNPRGQVPVMIIDGEPVKEGAAILTWLLDTHQSPLLPKSGIERARALEWLMWANASLHPTCSKMFWLPKLTIDDKAKAELKEAIVVQLQTLWDEAEAQLADHQYLAGDKVSVADILVTVIANWGLPVNLGPNVKRLIGEISQRPAYQKALQAEGVTYKAAA